MTRPPLRSTCALGALLILAVVAVAATARYTVTATIYNLDAAGNAFTLQSDGSTSAAYQTGTGIDSALTPDSTGAGTLYYQWNLDLTHSSRSYYLTLSPLNGSSAVFSGSVSFNGQLYSRCFTSSGGYQNWTQIQPNFPDTNCAMRANFTYNGTGYSLVMSPAQTGTGTATVSCSNWSSKSNSCVAWTDVPTAAITNANVANLYSGSTLVGQYYMSFNIVLTHP
jgi:hypothetical protein